MSVAKRLRDLPPELRNAGIAAAALVLSMFLPWYEKSYVPEGSRQFVQDNLSAFGVFSFVEAAVLLTAGGVLFLIWARSEQKAFHLPGGDGMAISLAGGWALALLVWRLFDKPDVSDPGATVGIQWGIFAAILAASALLVAGARVRAVHRPEPPNPAAEPVEPEPRPRRPDRRPAGPAPEALRERPDWSGEPPELPDRSRAPTRRLAPQDDEPTRRLDDRLF
jgi:hypothetical protein